MTRHSETVNLSPELLRLKGRLLVVKAKGRRPKENGRGRVTPRMAVLGASMTGVAIWAVWRVVTNGIPWSVRESVCRITDHLAGTGWRTGYTTSVDRRSDDWSSGVRFRPWNRCWVCGAES